MQEIQKEAVKENRAFREMQKCAQKWLKEKEPETIAANANVKFEKEKNFFEFQSLNETVKLRFPEYEFMQEMDEWQQLLTLHYLNIADGMEIVPEWISFGSLKDGRIRGTKFDNTVAKWLGEFFYEKSQKEAGQICRFLGAEIVESRADLSAVFSLFPNYPLRLNIWLTDDEFPCSARLLVNKNADHYLTVEDAVLAGELIMRKLEFADAFC